MFIPFYFKQNQNGMKWMLKEGYLLQKNLSYNKLFLYTLFKLPLWQVQKNQKLLKNKTFMLFLEISINFLVSDSIL
jgi:hypothetical protein